MYDVASEWKQVINVKRTAVQRDGKYLPIGAIEPDVLLTHSTIGLIVTSDSANPNWYRAGSLFQAYLVPFGTAGAAQGERVRVTLNRYTIHRFTVFPSIESNQYVLSYVPENYFRDVRLQVWEYIGVNQGATLDSLQALQRQSLQRLAGIKTSINQLTAKINKLG